jgi:integrase
MSTASSQDLARRNKTRHRGVSYRERADGSRTYAVFFKGRYLPAGTTEKEALAKQADLRGRQARGERIIVPSKITFAETAEQWFASKHRLRAWTRRAYRDALDNVLIPRFGSWKLAAIDADSIARLIRDLEKEGLHAIDPERPVRPLSASSIENYLKPLSGTLGLAVRRGLLASNVYRTLTGDDRPEKVDSDPAYEWSDEEIEGLLAASVKVAAERDSKYDYSPILRTAVYTGLRLGELLGLQWQDVDLDGGVLHVRRQYTLTGELTEPKTKKGLRRVPLGDNMVALLRRHKLASRFSQTEDFVFASRTGTPLSHRNVQVRGFEAARDEAELPGTLTFHKLRHAFASLAAHRGVPMSVLSEVMGHAHVGITQSIYMHLYGRDQAEESFRTAMAGGGT